MNFHNCYRFYWIDLCGQTWFCTQNSSPRDVWIGFCVQNCLSPPVDELFCAQNSSPPCEGTNSARRIFCRELSMRNSACRISLLRPEMSILRAELLGAERRQGIRWAEWEIVKLPCNGMGCAWQLDGLNSTMGFSVRFCRLIL